MSDQNNNQDDPKEGAAKNAGYSRFWELEESFFPSNEDDYASSFMNPYGASNELNRKRKTW